MSNDRKYQTATCAILFIAVVVTICVVTARMAHADTRLTMGGGVYHLTQDRDKLNEANYFVGVSHGPAFAATFVNSLGDRSFAGGAVLRTGNQVEASVYVGGVTGYRKPSYLQCSNNDVCAFAAPSVSWWLRDDVALTGVLFGDAAMYGVSVRW